MQGILFRFGAASILALSISSHGFSQAAMLNANPLDPFPANIPALNEIAKKDKSIEAAIESFKAGNIDQLKVNLAAAKTANSNLPAAEVMIARMRMANGQWSEALSVLEGYAATATGDAELHKCFAEIAMISGRWTDAWLQLEKAYALIDKMGFSDARKKDFIAELVKLRGEVAEQRKDYPAATKLFESLSKLQPNSGDPIWALGRIKISSGEIEQGAALLKKAKELSPILPQPELAVAIELSSKGKREEADKWFAAGLIDSANPKEANWIQYANYLIEQNRSKEALELINKVPDAYQSQRDFKLIRGIIYRYMDKSADAEKVLSELHRANVNDLDSSDHLALVLVESDDEGKRARAQQISESNLRQAPNIERVVATAAWVKFKTGSADVADKLLSQVVRSGRLSTQTAYYTAEILKSLGRMEEATNFLKVAVESPGAFPQKMKAKDELAELSKSSAEK